MQETLESMSVIWSIYYTHIKAHGTQCTIAHEWHIDDFFALLFILKTAKNIVEILVAWKCSVSGCHSFTRNLMVTKWTTMEAKISKKNLLTPSLIFFLWVRESLQGILFLSHPKWVHRINAGTVPLWPYANWLSENIMYVRFGIHLSSYPLSLCYALLFSWFGCAQFITLSHFLE